MPVIAVSGKGGTGKTLVSTLLIGRFKELDLGSLLAIDADPDSNLAESLGVTFERTIGDLRERLKDEIPPGVEKKKYLEGKVFEITIETEGFDLLVMGRPEGPGCYCAVNHMLRDIIDMTTDAYDYTIVDAEAGLEHLSRRTTQNVDTMLIVTDPSKKGFQTARRINELARELEIRFDNCYLVLNRVKPDNVDAMNEQAVLTGIEMIGSIPEDEFVAKYELEGKPLIGLPKNSKAYVAVSDITERII